MSRIIQVAILEEDPFSRNWISLLLTRDRRTRVVHELREQHDLFKQLSRKGQKVDLGVIDGSLVKQDASMLATIHELASPRRPPALMVLGNSPDGLTLQQFGKLNFQGYLLKEEIGFSVAWAATLVHEGYRVVTPGVQMLSNSSGVPLERPYLVLDGRGGSRNFTDYQNHVARLAILYSMERRDLSDELGISEEWAYGLVSSLYEKLGLKDLLSDELEPSDYFGNNPQILSFFKAIREEFKGSGKSRDMETLAFHLLSAPEIREIV